MPIALCVLLLILLLASVATTIAIRANHFINQDKYAKAATEAANAGLRAAIYRLNTYNPQANYCPTEPTNFAVGTNGAPTATLCAPDGPDVSQGLGNGANFSYWISRVMQSGDTCTGPSLSSSASTVAQRCVTSVGTANGLSARVQERVAAYTSTPAFPAAIFGTKSVTIGNNVTIVSDTANAPALLGTNGILTVGGTGGGTTTIDGYQLPPGATLNYGNNVVNLGPTKGISAPYPTPTPIYPFSTAQNTSSPYDTAGTFQAGTCNQQEAQKLGWSGSWVQTNCDYEISRGITFPGCVNLLVLPVSDCDPNSGLSSTYFNATNRTLYLPNGSSLVLQGGYYNFCSVYLGNNAQITVANGGQATLFIDSPSDPSSGCSTGNSAQGIAAGTFTMSQNATFNPGGSALNAQILVYGDQANTPPLNTVSLQNNGSSSFALLAPFSNVLDNPSSNTLFRGAIVGYTVSLGQASGFIYEADTSTFQSTAVPIYYPSSWEQCPTQSSSSTDPTAGC
jgi:hypothetical protein